MRQDGFTIIEIIIGLVLLSSAMLIGAMTFASVIHLHEKGQSARFVQQNGLYSLESVQRDVRNSDVANVYSNINPTNPAGGSRANAGNFILLAGAGQSAATVIYGYCGDPGWAGNADCNGRPTAILRYDYSQAGSCAGGKATCDDVSGEDVRIVNNGTADCAAASVSPIFKQSPSTDLQPFIDIHLEVEQSVQVASQFDPSCQHYNLDSTAEVRQ